MTAVLAGLGDVAFRPGEGGVEPAAMLLELTLRPVRLTKLGEQRSGILTLQAFLHVLRGDDRIVVFRKNSL